ncbi:MAG TPA: amidase, partial [Burkholderiales bacterium]|nr:amidase [Burkholderiales bacterium]
MGALNTLAAVDAAHQIAAKKITSEALVRDCLERIDAREGEVRAWEYLDREAALMQARAADARPSGRLLHGLPVGVKDLIDTVDMPATYGSPIYAGHRPQWDAPCVALTRAAGGIVIGKTVTTEFAVMHPGKTRNPHNLAHTPGGSSSGSAAAVADYMVPLAFGSQTAGSVIRPAAYCGTVGYKPSFGLISRVGVKALSDTLDTIGTIARTVPDAALLAAAITGRRDLLVEKPLFTKLRVGICRTFEWKHAQAETVAAFEDVATRLGAAGVNLREVKLPPTYASLAHAQTDIMLVEQALSLAHER